MIQMMCLSKNLATRTAGLLTVAVLLASCVRVDTAAPVPVTAFSLISPGLPDNGLLLKKHAGNYKANPNCDGANVSPPLQWFNPPEKTVSYVVMLRSPTGRAGMGEAHWVAYGIPADITSLPEGSGSTAAQYIVRGKGSIGSDFYAGPCPPRGNAPQHYVFTVIATDLNIEALKPGLTKPELMPYLKGHTLSAASFVLRYAQ